MLLRRACPSEAPAIARVSGGSPKQLLSTPNWVHAWRPDNRELLVSGLVENGTEIAQHPAVVDVPLDKGHVITFSNNPIWRGETQGSYFLVFNAIMNFDSLGAGRKLDEK